MVKQWIAIQIQHKQELLHNLVVPHTSTLYNHGEDTVWLCHWILTWKRPASVASPQNQHERTRAVNITSRKVLADWVKGCFCPFSLPRQLEQCLPSEGRECFSFSPPSFLRKTVCIAAHWEQLQAKYFASEAAQEGWRRPWRFPLHPSQGNVWLGGSVECRGAGNCSYSLPSDITGLDHSTKTTGPGTRPGLSTPMCPDPISGLGTLVSVPIPTLFLRVVRHQKCPDSWKQICPIRSILNISSCIQRSNSLLPHYKPSAKWYVEPDATPQIQPSLFAQ